MGNIRVENCCCFSLETGVTILGAFDLIFGVLVVIGGGIKVNDNTFTGTEIVIQGSKYKFRFN